jgi:hypothetical protein
MLIGYARVSKADGSQVLGLQRDALAAVGVESGRIYEDLASGPTMEEVGYRSAIFEFDGMAGHQLPYIRWVLGKCAADGTGINDMIDPAAIELLVTRLKTPLQIEQYLALAFEEAFRIGERPVSAQVIEAVLSRHLEDLEPRLTRHGYTLRSLVEQFSAKPAEIRQSSAGN